MPPLHRCRRGTWLLAGAVWLTACTGSSLKVISDYWIIASHPALTLTAWLRAKLVISPACFAVERNREGVRYPALKVVVLVAIRDGDDGGPITERRPWPDRDTADDQFRLPPLLHSPLQKGILRNREVYDDDLIRVQMLVE